MTNGCRLSAGTFRTRNMPAKTSSKLYSTRPLAFGLALQPQRHLEVGLARGRGFDVDLNVDGRLLRARRQRARRVRVLERQILHILPEDGDLRHRHLWLGAAICRRHTDLRRARALAAWLTQGREVNNAGGRTPARGDIAANFGAPAQMTANIALKPLGMGGRAQDTGALRCWRGGGNRLDFRGRAVVISSGLWMAPRACLHNEWEPGSRQLFVALG